MGAIRIAQIMGAMNGAGVENVIMNYYRAIDRGSFQFDFIVDETSKHVPEEEIRRLGGTVVAVPPVSDIRRFSPAVEAVLREGAYPIVHSNLNALSVFSLRAAKKAGIPVRIAHSHSTAGKGELVRNAAKAVLKLAANTYPTHRIACSQHAGEWLFGKKTPFEVLHNAIDLSRFAFDAQARAQVRESLGIAEGCFCVGHIGRFMEQKNHRFLLKAFQAFSQRMADAKLVLVGEGKLEDEMRSLARELGVEDRVVFAGFADDASSFYSAFDCFMLPSLYEGLGMVAIEAQANGLPCLLSDKVPAEAVVSDGCRFLSIEDSDIPHWADALETASCTGRIKALDDRIRRYDISHEAKRLEDMYRTFLDGCTACSG